VLCAVIRVQCNRLVYESMTTALCAVMGYDRLNFSFESIPIKCLENGNYSSGKDSQDIFYSLFPSAKRYKS